MKSERVITSVSKSPMIVPSNTRSTALVVDDEKDICYLLNFILRQKNIPTQLAGSLAEAEKLIEKQSPSIIFLDNHLPDGLGIENISRLKKNLPQTKIVMISAHDNLSDRKRAYDEGVDFFISKPFKKEAIVMVLDNIQKRRSGE